MKELCKIGKLYKTLREREGCTVRGQAALIGISPSYFVDICYGNRALSYEVFKKTIAAYKNKLSNEEFIILGTALNSPDVYERFKEVTGIFEDIRAIREFTYIITGEIVL